MNNDLTYDEILDKLPAYTLGALEPDEMLAVDAYIHKHEDLLARLYESEQAAVQLAYLAPTAPLPAQAKDRLLERVRADLETRPAAEREAMPVAELSPAEKQAPRSTVLTRPQPDTKRSWLADFWIGLNVRTGWAWAVGGALVVLLVVSFYVSQSTAQMQTQLRQAEAERDQTQAEMTQLAAENNQMQEQLQQAEADRSQLQAETAQLGQANNQLQERLSQLEADFDQLEVEAAQLRADSEQLRQANQNLIQQLETEQGRLDLIVNSAPVVVPGTEEAPQALAVMYRSSDNEQVLMILHGLNPLPPDKTYQLWLIPANQSPVPAGLVTVQTEEPTLMLAQIPPQAEEFSSVGISIEPSGGSLAPTGPIVLLGTVG